MTRLELLELKAKEAAFIPPVPPPLVREVGWETLRGQQPFMKCGTVFLLRIERKLLTSGQAQWL